MHILRQNTPQSHPITHKITLWKIFFSPSWWWKMTHEASSILIYGNIYEMTLGIDIAIILGDFPQWWSDVVAAFKYLASEHGKSY